MTVRRLRPVAVVIVAACLLAVGWIGARRFESPAQREARAAPPTPRAIYEPVTSGSLVDQVSARGTVEQSAVYPLEPTALPERAVVTATNVAQGQEIRAGDLALAINGRPVVALPGSFGFYRDLTPGLVGPDVAQLQQGLAAAGLPTPPSEAGTFGIGTERAVAALYRRVGYPPATVDVPVAAAAGPQVRRAPTVPLTEVLVAPALPAVVRTSPRVGHHPAGDAPLLTLSRGEFVVASEVANSAVARLRPGMAATITPSGGPDRYGRVWTIDTIDTTDAANAADSAGTSKVTIVGAAPLPAAWAGASVVSTITIEVAADDGLLVPSRAVATTASGERVVLVATSGGSRRVAVTVRGTLAGRSAVNPVDAGALEVGDRVKVG